MEGANVGVPEMQLIKHKVEKAEQDGNLKVKVKDKYRIGRALLSYRYMKGYDSLYRKSIENQ